MGKRRFWPAALLVALMTTGCASFSPPARASGPVAVVDRQLDAYNRRDLDAFSATYHEDVKVYRMPTEQPTLTGKAALREFYRTARFNRPDLHATVLSRMVLAPDMVVDHERIRGLGAEPMEAVVVYRVRDDRIQSVWIFVPD